MAVTKSAPLGARRNDPFVFKTFFEFDLEESESPFLTPFSRRVAKNLNLKASLFAGALLILAFCIQTSPLAQILLALVYLVVGAPLLINSIDDIVREKEVNIDVLMTVAAFAAYFLGSKFEGGLLLVLFALSGSIESLVTLQAKNALSKIHSLAPTKAYIIDDEYIVKERAVEDVPLKSHILVRAGEIVPLDGIITHGASSLSFQHITGESTPIFKSVGDEVQSGAQVIESSLTIEVTHTNDNSTVARIIALITQAEKSKPHLERTFDRFGRYYALAIILLACGMPAVFYYWLHLPFWGPEGAIYRALAFLIAASPCALILAVPIAYLSALGACARRGAVLKGGVVLDQLNACNAVAFDKTGTLTRGELKLAGIERLSGSEYTEDELIRIAASLEQHVVHPIAKAFLQIVEGIPLFAVEDVRVIPGKGIEGVVQINKRQVNAFIGIHESGSLLKKGKITSVLKLPNAEVLFFFEDALRGAAAATVKALNQRGKKIFMLTGDNEESASKVAKRLSIDTYYAALKPEEKLAMIAELSRTYGLVMCGDGINDAPALARATVGISLGKIGSAAAKEVSDCILLNDDLSLVDWLFTKAAVTRSIVWQNVAVALSVIFIASVPALLGELPLWCAVVLHEGGTVLVGLNAIRLLR